ncbi:MAG: glycoside hydrolase family 95-like protein [bacterium]
MQMDAGMGAVTAILELLVQCRQDGIYVLPGLPKHWHSLTFDGIRTEGAFLLGGTVREGELCEIRVTSLAGGPIELVHGFHKAWKLNGKAGKGPRVSRNTRPGETLKLSRD